MRNRGRERDEDVRDGTVEKGDLRRRQRGGSSSAWLQLTEFERDQKKRKQKEKREKSEERRFGGRDVQEGEEYCDYHGDYESDVHRFLVRNKDYWLTRIAPRQVRLCPSAFADKGLEYLDLVPLSEDSNGQDALSTGNQFQERAAHLYPERRSPHSVSDSPSPQTLVRKLFGK